MSERPHDDQLRHIAKEWDNRVFGDIAKELLAARALLKECDLQLEYLDSRFPTGTTPSIRARIAAELGEG